MDKIRQKRFSPQSQFHRFIDHRWVFVQRQLTVRFALTVAKQDLGFHPWCAHAQVLENAITQMCWKCSGFKDGATAHSGVGAGTSGCNLNPSSACKFWSAQTNGNRCLTHLPSDAVLRDSSIMSISVGLADLESSRSPGVALTPKQNIWRVCSCTSESFISTSTTGASVLCSLALKTEPDGGMAALDATASFFRIDNVAVVGSLLKLKTQKRLFENWCCAAALPSKLSTLRFWSEFSEFQLDG